MKSRYEWTNSNMVAVAKILLARKPELFSTMFIPRLEMTREQYLDIMDQIEEEFADSDFEDFSVEDLIDVLYENIRRPGINDSEE